MRQALWLLFAAAAACLAARAAERGAPASGATSSGVALAAQRELPAGSLVFHERTGEQFDVFVSDDGGRTARNLSVHPADDTNPSLSPDGTRVAFQSLRAGRSHLFVVPRLGGAATPLTSGAAMEQSPCWSPDGKMLYFDSHRSGRWRICRVASSGGSAVTTLDSGDFDCISPAMSPDGKRIACELRRHGTERWNVGMLDLDGRVLWESGVAGSDFNETPSVSPDGRWVYFAASAPGGYFFWRLPADGRGPAEPIARWAGWKLHPVPVGNGKFLIFDEKTPAGWRLGWLNLATGEHGATPSQAERFSPQWRDSAR